MKRKKIIIAIHILLIAICLITTGISAANLIGADSVQYKDTTVKAALDELIDKANKNSIGTLRLRSRVGDYVRMTPTSTSYSISKDLTGLSSDQTINPSELNLWRVISLNEDGTIDMVSEYVSSMSVHFYGQAGYLNFVGALNTIAKQYENSEFTVGSRYMGYNGQTEYITDISRFVRSPWTYNTRDNSNEEVGGGDILYETDYNLVKNALGTAATQKVGTTTSTVYWLSSRYYHYNRSSYYGLWNGRSVSEGGSVSSDYFYYCNDSGWKNSGNAHALRPIVTLRAGINEVSGSGTSTDPWVLS